MDHTLTETQTWPDLLIGLYDKLTGRGAEITYEFRNLEIQVPSSATASAVHAPWKISGVVKNPHNKMKRLLPVLELDLQIEHDGHRLALAGSGRKFVAKVESLRALIHFGLRAWPFRKMTPTDWRLQLEWKGHRFPSDRRF